MKIDKISEIDDLEVLKSLVNKICIKRMSNIDRSYILAALDRAYRLGARDEEYSNFWSGKYSGP